MRVSRAEMERSHQRIVEQAAGLLRERGVIETSVADVMSAAGLTHGGFYRHFENKQALVAAAVHAAFDQMTAVMERNREARAPEAARSALHDYYLSEHHLAHAATACPVPTLAGDLARTGPELKAVFGEGVNQLLDSVMRCHDGTPEQRRTAAMREFALLVGAAVIARASDDGTAAQVRAACLPLS